MNVVNDNKRIEYDVFISAKSEDYDLAEGVSKFLEANGLSVFLASVELRKIGKSQYGEAIDIALDAAKHMIVVASCIDYIRSPFVHFEWSLFSNDIKSGYRTGNLLTILTDEVSLRELPPSLRHQQSYSIDTYQREILSYLGRAAENKQLIVPNGRKKNNRHWKFLIGLLVVLNVALVIFVGIEVWHKREPRTYSIMGMLGNIQNNQLIRYEQLLEKANASPIYRQSPSYENSGDAMNGKN